MNISTFKFLPYEMVMYDVKDKKDIPPIINALPSTNLVVLLILSDL